MNNNNNHEKDFIIAKMNQKTALTTAIIGSVVTIFGVITPIVISSNQADKTTQPEVQVTPFPTEDKKSTPTPTPSPEDDEKKKGKGKS